MTVSHALPQRAIKASGLACSRGETLLFQGLDFEIGPGELLLLRGANGTGKSTLLLALAGFLRPAAGAVEILGGSETAAADVHFLGHSAAVSGRLTLEENLRFWSTLCGGDPELVEPALETVGLAQLGHLEADLLSAGQHRRLALARLLCAARPIWLLDEPTAALDSAGELLVAALIEAHLQRGGLVAAATHHDIVLRPPAMVRTLRLGAM